MADPSHRTGERLLQSAHGLAPLHRKNADRCERDRRLAEELPGDPACGPLPDDRPAVSAASPTGARPHVQIAGGLDTDPIASTGEPPAVGDPHVVVVAAGHPLPDRLGALDAVQCGPCPAYGCRRSRLAKRSTGPPDDSAGTSPNPIGRPRQSWLVGAAIRACPSPAPSLLIGGLGVAFSLAEARHGHLTHITVVEIEPAVIASQRAHLSARSENAADEPRVALVCADLVGWLDEPGPAYDAICLDIDNGPQWTVTDHNRILYGHAGLVRLHRRLAGGGVLAVWSASRSRPFEARLRRHLTTVGVREGARASRRAGHRLCRSGL
jgi:hypothetical protein